MDKLPANDMTVLDDPTTSGPENPSARLCRTQKPLSTLRRNIKLPGVNPARRFNPAKINVQPGRTTFMDWQIDSDLERLVKAEMNKPKKSQRPRFKKAKNERLQFSNTNKPDLEDPSECVVRLPDQATLLNAEITPSLLGETEVGEIIFQDEQAIDHIKCMLTKCSAESLSDEAAFEQLRGVTALLPPSERAFGSEVYEQFKQVSAPSRIGLGQRKCNFQRHH